MFTLCPFQNKIIAFPFFSLTVVLIVTVWASQPIEWGLSDPGNRENNVIFISGDISSPPHYQAAVNGSFCPHRHERTCHLSVSPNWLFTTFHYRHRQIRFWSSSGCHSVWRHSTNHSHQKEKYFLYNNWYIAYLHQCSHDLDTTSRNCFYLKVKLCRQKALYWVDISEERLESFRYWQEQRAKDRKRFSIFYQSGPITNFFHSVHWLTTTEVNSACLLFSCKDPVHSILLLKEEYEVWSWTYTRSHKPEYGLIIFTD